MRPGKGVIVLIADTNWRVEALGQFDTFVDAICQYYPRAIQNDGRFGRREQVRGLL